MTANVEAISTQALLSVKDLHVSFGSAVALRGVSFDVHAGEVVTIIGGNGAGKSTTLKTISGLSEMLKNVLGSIFFEGASIVHRRAHRIVKSGIVHVPEGRRVFPYLTAEENLQLGAYRRRRDTPGIAEDMARVYERFPVLSERKNQMAGLMSGGEQQMLAIGRAIMARPRFLMLDEPSLGLAPLVVKEMFNVIRSLADDGTTILLVEQMALQALKIADRAYILERGEITKHGPASELITDPYVQKAFLGA